MKIEAVIFDMDGLMFETEALWLYGVKKTNEEYEYNVPLNLIIDCMGNRKNDIDNKLKKELGDNFDTEKFREINKRFMNEYVKDHGLAHKEGLLNLLEYLYNNKIRMAIASSSKHDKILTNLKQANINNKYFEKIISGDMVTKSKPDPEIYLKVCEELNVNPKNCIALEDSEYGITSAHNAGLIAFLIPDIKQPTVDTIKTATKIFKSLNSVMKYISENIEK